ncbi:MAG: PAS domain-containing protein, partial [Verrucomicrobiota bacterium]
TPGSERPVWMRSFLRSFGDDPDARWGGRFVRLASDLMLVCNEELEIIFHNRAFMKAIGYDEGSYVGESLTKFFPLMDRADAGKAFDSLMGGNSGGIRIDCSLLTVRGERRFVARATRSRRSEGESIFIS